MITKMHENRLCAPFVRVTRDELIINGVIIYGGSGWGILIKNELSLHGIEALWMIDADPKLEGQLVEGTVVRSPSSLHEAGESFVMLGSTHIKEMSLECEKCNVKKWIAPASIRDWCPITGDFGICMDGERNIDELVSTHELLADEKSRDVFEAFIRWHYSYDNDFSKLCDVNAYFPSDLRSRIDYSVFIDAGAYTGDTLSDWIHFFDPHNKDCQYFAFEPNPISCVAIDDYVRTLPEAARRNIVVANAALGIKDGFVEIGGWDGGSYTKDSTSGTPCKRIDDYFSTLFPTIIKADIEGAEMDLLRGAEQTIRRCRPTLAISLYHRYSDIWEIPSWINGLSLDYDIYVRHHAERFTDSVCYAIPRNNSTIKELRQ